MSILIVEDNTLSAKVLESTLQNHGYEILIARDGKQAVEYLELHPEIDGIITDMVMPNTNGVELIKILKQRPEWSELPVVICSSMNAKEVAGASDGLMGFHHLLKPINSDSLLHTVKQASAKQRPIMQNGNQIMSRLGVDDQGFVELVDEFLKLVEEKIEVLQQEGAATENLEFNDLLEGAKLLGAERIMNAIDRYGKVGMTGEHRSSTATSPLLLREFKALRCYLNAYSVQNSGPSQSAPKKIQTSGSSSDMFVAWQPDNLNR
jgi:CheY-like chemotaxis protein